MQESKGDLQVFESGRSKSKPSEAVLQSRSCFDVIEAVVVVEINVAEFPEENLSDVDEKRRKENHF